ncbi:hypothetical protein GW17_00016417, partial [Ensete ventricosum]
FRVPGDGRHQEKTMTPCPLYNKLPKFSGEGNGGNQDHSFLLLNPKDTDSHSKSLLQVASHA